MSKPVTNRQRYWDLLQGLANLALLVMAGVFLVLAGTASTRADAKSDFTIGLLLFIAASIDRRKT